MNQPSKINRRSLLAGAGALVVGAPGLSIATRVQRRLDGPIAEDFVAHVGSKFYLQSESGETIPAELVSVSPCKYAPGPGFRKPFSVLFRLQSQVRQQQDSYEVRHRSLGSMRLLLTQVSPPGVSPLYETVFG